MFIYYLMNGWSYFFVFVFMVNFMMPLKYIIQKELKDRNWSFHKFVLLWFFCLVSLCPSQHLIKLIGRLSFLLVKLLRLFHYFFFKVSEQSNIPYFFP